MLNLKSIAQRVTSNKSGVEAESDDRSARRSLWEKPRRLLTSDYQALWLSLIWFLALLPAVPEIGSADNLANIFSNLLPLLIVAIGQTIVLITGGVDLSVTSTIALASVAGAMVMSADQGGLGGSAFAAPCGIFLMLIVGAAVGAINGFAVAWFRMPPFIVTLTTMMFFSGLAIWLTQSKSVYGLPPAFIAIGKGSIGGIPIALFVAIVVAAIAHLLLGRTLYGRWLYAIGGNRRAATISGVPVSGTLMLAYIGSGLCAGVASILYTGRLETGSPVLAQRILLDVIGATVIGGASLFGGKGKIPWTTAGALFITLIDNGLNMLGLSYFFIMMVKGGVILLAALLDAWRNRLQTS
jgi:ribose/xylose/arabinose/galactoside ABC-type transport system permease subunit